ncbi:NAD(P)/FAD-dependent oxidoreductase [bacterium M00.F.Ca.ET.228.01.1.1]|nr:NAD(P)/FAD-dependent oxidoreductase [bacterium M00.F.Ca.ET.228.01.1.1]TGR95284.1 NAD(P)/FAD-dependent oxidoreductase [bacterium M00.F.Ca.ET.191.01.1.1]TGT96133.1 NAD(P)/FAD-dependent oxidoreductase [bacterium M00.F.Ca.ET.155.01.1.1]
MTQKWDVIVVGGGPAGSTSATYLARLGYKVLLIERDEFPRHRIGESLLPSMMPVLEDFGLIDACRKAGFVEKTGATFIWGKTREPWDIRFADTPFLPSGFAFHVDRAAFDKILLDNARVCGTEVLRARVSGPLTEDGRVVGVTYEDANGKRETARASYVIDASGAASVIGRNVTERRYDDKMRQVALYSYYRNIRGAEGFRQGHITVESSPKGWFWFIPMDSEELGEVSLGLVTGQEFTDEIRTKGAEAFYEEALSLAPNVRKMIGPDAQRVKPINIVRDWAYTCDKAAGPGYYLAGDAAAFLDPLLSTGVSLAMLAGYSASVCIHTALSEPSLEQEATEFYANNYRQMYEVTRDFLHYFYAGNASAHPNEIFWNARRALKFDENIGAKQAFSFFINTIPGNPHPALKKQIPMFQQFMTNLDHTVNEVTSPTGEFMTEQLRPADRLEEGDVPVVNGRLESSWQFNREKHLLEQIRGVTFDRNRPVFSSTSSWLLGRNIAALQNEAWDVLKLVDGQQSWSSIVGQYTAAQKDETGQDSGAVSDIIKFLLAERFVLVRDRA